MPDSFKSFTADLAKLTLFRDREMSPALARVLTDLYVQEERPHGVAEMIRYGALMAGLLERLGTRDRRIIAEKLSRRPDAPVALLRMLAEDEPEVAAPVIERALQLDELMLLRLAERNEASREAIARRGGLTRQLLLRLVEYGGPETLAALARNGAARFDPPLLSRLADRLRDVPEAARLFVEREDVEGADAAPLFLAASEAGRRKILAGLEARTAGPGRAAADPLVAALSTDIGRTLLDHAIAQRSAEIAATLAKLLRLPSPLADAIVADEGGEPLLVALKALRMPEQTVVSVLLHANLSVGRSARRLFALGELSASFGAAAANRLIASLRREPPRAGHEPQLASAVRARRAGDVGRAAETTHAAPAKDDKTAAG